MHNLKQRREKKEERNQKSAVKEGEEREERGEKVGGGAPNMLALFARVHPPLFH